MTTYTAKAPIGVTIDGDLVPYDDPTAAYLFKAAGQPVTDDELTGHDATKVVDLLEKPGRHHAPKADEPAPDEGDAPPPKKSKK